METLIVRLARAASLLIAAGAVAIVSYGAIEAFVGLFRIVATPGASDGERKIVWRRFGIWLLLGLEFELAADIIGTVVSPTWQDIGALGAIAVIRTFLNHFLEKDFERAASVAGERTIPSGGPLQRLPDSVPADR